MRRLYAILRVVGYAAGAAGLALFLAGSRLEPKRPALQAAGGILLAVMFAAFLTTYVFYAAAALKRGGRR
ncbi:MAG: hypothetical protein JXB04_07855 [Kiritimatiellae bacterium]|nr:hypothetical protein [Kiritimatiellia bacterium]